MENAVIILIILLILALGTGEVIRHFRGQGGCCGGSTYKPKKKKLSGVLYEKTFHVDGMHCEHCKCRVEEVVNDMKGIAGTVNLKKGELTVLYAEEVDDALIRERIERAGYTVVEK